MPSPPKVSWSRLRVGITALVAMAILGVLIFLLTTSGNIFKGKAHLRTYMDDASGTAESAPVRLNGIPIGNLKKINLRISIFLMHADDYLVENRAHRVSDCFDQRPASKW